MTAQVPEEIRYLDIDYTILAIENKGHFIQKIMALSHLLRIQPVIEDIKVFI